MIQQKQWPFTVPTLSPLHIYHNKLLISFVPLVYIISSTTHKYNLPGVVHVIASFFTRRLFSFILFITLCSWKSINIIVYVFVYN